MKWDSNAESAIKRVPFFVRKRVRKRVEDHAAGKGKHTVELSDVDELKQKFLLKGGMEKEIRGYDVSKCFGGDGCPNASCSTGALAGDIERILKDERILEFLKSRVKGDLKFHHEFRVALADCVNACSRPQIADIGIIGCAQPGLSDNACSGCGACVEACEENAVSLEDDPQVPRINYARCLMCKKCITQCPTGKLVEKRNGYRVMLGGRLGRHPRLAMEVLGLKSHDEVLKIVQSCIDFYKINSKNGERFSHVLVSVDQV